MDSITHTVLGACTGQLIAGKQIGKKAMLVGAIVNNLPDLDMLANFWNSTAEGLLSHRGITHSFFFAVFSTPILIALFRWLFRIRDLEYTKWIYLVGHGLLLHILMDAFTTYGTGWFEPFSHYRVSFNTLFILDPFFMLPVLSGAILLLAFNPGLHKLRTITATVALCLSLLYLIVTMCIKIYVNKHVKAEMTRQSISADSYMESPTPLNNLLWYILVKQKDQFQTGYYSILDRNPAIHFDTIPQNDHLLRPYKQDSDIQCLTRFSKGYYTMQTQANVLRFCDMRFGQLQREENKQQFVFCFVLDTSSGKLRVKQAPFRDGSKKDFQNLYSRIKGN